MFSQMAPLMNGKMGAGAEMMMRGGGHGGFGGGLGSVFSTVIIVLAVLWVVKNWDKISAWLKNTFSSLKKSVATAATTSSSGQAPLEIVQMRYAKGEISKEEYETLRRDLSGEGTPIPVTEAPAGS